MRPGDRRLMTAGAFLTCALVTLALAALSAGAGQPRALIAPGRLTAADGPTFASARAPADGLAQTAPATVADLEREFDREFASRPAPAGPAPPRTASSAGGPDAVLADAQAFYQRLTSRPIRVEPPGSARGAGQVATADAALMSGPQRSAGMGTAPADSSPLLEFALNHSGVPYKWGGASRDGLDCSGLVVRAARDLGLRLPHSAAELYQFGESVPDSALQAGDLVFFADTYKPGISHVGIYESGSRFVQSSSGAGKVTVGDLNRPYYQRHYAGARRLSIGTRILATARRWVASAGAALTAPFRFGDG